MRTTAPFSTVLMSFDPQELNFFILFIYFRLFLHSSSFLFLKKHPPSQILESISTNIQTLSTNFTKDIAIEEQLYENEPVNPRLLLDRYRKFHFLFEQSSLPIVLPWLLLNISNKEDQINFISAIRYGLLYFIPKI